MKKRKVFRARSMRANASRRKLPRKSAGLRNTRQKEFSSSRQPVPNIGDQGPAVIFRSAQGDLAKLNPTQSFQDTVERWSFVLQSRRRWARQAATRRHQAARAKKELLSFGLDDAVLGHIARAGHIEVSIGSGDSAFEVFARHVPWEYLLSAATADRRNGSPLMITRQLNLRDPATIRAPSTLLFVESAPGKLGREFNFSSERQIVFGALGLPSSQIQIAENETEEQLKKRFQKDPDIIHYAGVEAHECVALLGECENYNPMVDGVVLSDTENRPVVVSATQFASDLKGSVHAPVLVAFNCYNSASELAAYALREGVAAAIGIYDEIDDEIAEFFFGAFYREWRLNNWDTSKAFTAAWQSLRGFAYLHGTGVVLWTSNSVFMAPSARDESTQTEAARRPKKAKPVPNAAAQMFVDPKVVAEINYSLLHNEQPIFRSFLIHRVKDGPPLQVDVTVELNVGMDSYPFRATEVLDREPLSLTEKVKIPLTSSLARSLRERVQSTLYLKVAVGEEIVHQQTNRVTLLPIDEWSDDESRPTAKDPADKRSVWLPSFVLPRDPSVARIIDSAQRYLMALQDAPDAGFDGYQQIDQNDLSTRSFVDRQVQAIWCALSYEWELSYINPPPSYSLRTQRLRTPSDVLAGKRGTCIDLALLFAACLEYIDIYPSLILLKGHAFPAYWRSDGAHESFVLADPSGRTATASATSTSSGIGNRDPGSVVGRYGWVIDKRQLGELMQCIQRGDLVPLETVWLTNHSGFSEACEAGLQNLRNSKEFDSMLDVIQARRNQPPVTPLPIIQTDN